jgi:hypothetical protein
VIKRYQRMRFVGLCMFAAGMLSIVGLPGFSLVPPGDELWKQTVRVVLLVCGFAGFGVYGYAVYQLNRLK